jgi:hypothetical protein
MEFIFVLFAFFIPFYIYQMIKLLLQLNKAVEHNNDLLIEILRILKGK